MKPFVLLGLLTLTSLAAQAADGVMQPRVGAALAIGTFSGDNSPPGVLSSNVDDKAVGFKIYGQYPVNKWLAVEGAYHDTSNFKSKQSLADLPPGDPGGQYALSLNGWSLQGLVYIPVPVEDLQAYVKGGYYAFSDEIALNGENIGSSSERGVVLGGGLLLKLGRNLGVRTDFDWFDAKVGDLSSINFGIEYFFGSAGGK